MTKAERNGFRTILTSRLAELENQNRSRGALTIETSPDELDRIQDSQERELAIGALDRNSARLREVRAALARIDTDRFGICGECEEKIHPKRLAAVPWAAFCVVCQEAADGAQRTAWGEIDESFVMAA